MKYFTSERLVRLQDRSDERSFLAALEESERAIKRYKESLLRIRGELPKDLQQLIDTVSLHDARILDMWWGGRSQFTMTLHPESEPSRLVVLTYSLVAPPLVDHNVLPEAVRSEPVAWLYDELSPDCQPDKGAFNHRILLSDGREVCVRFRNVKVKRPVPLVPMAARPARSRTRSGTPRDQESEDVFMLIGQTNCRAWGLTHDVPVMLPLFALREPGLSAAKNCGKISRER